MPAPASPSDAAWPLAAVLAFDLDASFLTRTDAAFRRTLSPDEELVCVAETDACCVDAVQLLLGCTLGKGNLLLRPRGKTAMSFYHRPARLAVRILWQADIHAPDGREMSRGEKNGPFPLRPGGCTARSARHSLRAAFPRAGFPLPGLCELRRNDCGARRPAARRAALLP